MECFFFQFFVETLKKPVSCPFSLSQLLVSLAMFPRVMVSNILYFSSLPGDMMQLDEHIFRWGWLVQPVSSFLASGVALAKQPLKWSKLV